MKRMRLLGFVAGFVLITLTWVSCDEKSAVERAQMWNVDGITPTTYYCTIPGYEEYTYDVYVVEEGDGNRPSFGQTINIHFNTFLEDGTCVASTLDEDFGTSFSGADAFPIIGLKEGILKMSHGAKFRFVFPPEIAHGDEYTYGGLSQGVPARTIPPNSYVIYDITMESQH